MRVCFPQPPPALLSTSHAAWDLDAGHGVHATYSANNLGAACRNLTSGGIGTSLQVLVEPVQHRLPGLLGSFGVVARAGVIEERVAGPGEGANFVCEAGRLERRLGAIPGRVDPFILFAVD